MFICLPRWRVITGSPKQEKKMSKLSCFLGEFLGTPCSSYKVGDIDIDEITTIDRCTRDITGHLQVLHLRESTELKSKADLIFLCSGKCKSCVIQFLVGGTLPHTR